MMRFIPTPRFSPHCLPLGNLSIIDKGPHSRARRIQEAIAETPTRAAATARCRIVHLACASSGAPHKAPQVRVAGRQRDTAVTQASAPSGRRTMPAARNGDNGTRRHRRGSSSRCMRPSRPPRRGETKLAIFITTIAFERARPRRQRRSFKAWDDSPRRLNDCCFLFRSAGFAVVPL